jgi:hypothetical protein
VRIKMKSLTLSLLFILFPALLAAQNLKFDNYFLDKTMRIDYFHIGDASTEIVTLDRIYVYGIWAGSLKNLIDNFNNGKYYVKIYDKKSGTLIFSKGFDTYFGEYKTTSKAAEGIQRAYHESALIPYPKDIISFAIERRNNTNELEEFFHADINPEDVSIVRDTILSSSIRIYEDKDNGDPHNRVDVAILAEGYAVWEKQKFEEDLKRFTNIFFDIEPYKSHKNRFNFYGVYKPSEESGVDEPDANIFKNTAFSATFNSLGSARYLLTEDNKTMRDAAAHVPYDALYIMVNTKRYGGGGIYNLFCTFTADNQWHEYLFLHEFGHSFAGLADEYYTSDVAYNDFYPKGIEPVEPNITSLLNPPAVKWDKFVTKGIEIPTLWEKAAYDSMDYAWQSQRRKLNEAITILKKEKAPPAEISKAEEEYDRKDRAHAEEVDKFVKSSKYWGKVGAFEGAGYSSNGLYRPMLDCIMFSKGKKPFCKVCEDAIIAIIKQYSQ